MNKVAHVFGLRIEYTVLPEVIWVGKKRGCREN